MEPFTAHNLLTYKQCVSLGGFHLAEMISWQQKEILASVLNVVFEPF